MKIQLQRVKKTLKIIEIVKLGNKCGKLIKNHEKMVEIWKKFNEIR